MSAPVPIVLVALLFGFFILPIALVPDDDIISGNNTALVVTASPIPAASDPGPPIEVVTLGGGTPELLVDVSPAEDVGHLAVKKPEVSPSLQLHRFDVDNGGLLTKSEFVAGCQTICSRLHCGEVDCDVCWQLW
jgi:hypothetical protein